MKDKTITVRVPDFCPEDCPEFEIYESRGEYLRFDDVTLVHSTYTCKNEDRCRMLHTQLETRYCADCRDAMKARGDEIEMNDQDDDEDAVISYKIKDALPGACFHGEVWHRCPYCNEAWEAMGATYKDIMGIGKTYKCEKCGRIMRVR